MKKYVFHNPQAEVIVPSRLQNHLHERGRSLVQMMSSRKSIRVLCAPALFGKSVLAFQYAKIVFPEQDVLWVKADDPRFLRDLDADRYGVSVDSAELEKPEAVAEAVTKMAADTAQGLDYPKDALIVFDAVPVLSRKRQAQFTMLAALLQKLRNEVIITTRGLPKYHLEQAIPADQRSPRLIISAQDLLLDSHEVSWIAPSLQHSTRGWACPAVLCDKEQGQQRFMISLENLPLSSHEEALLCTALILQWGTQTDLLSFVNDSADMDLRAFVKHYPHAGLKNHSFSALMLTPKERFSLLWSQLPRLVEQSPYVCQHDYLVALLGRLNQFENTTLIDCILQYCMEDDERTEYCKQHAAKGEVYARRKEPLTFLANPGMLMGTAPAGNPKANGDQGGEVDAAQTIAPADEAAPAYVAAPADEAAPAAPNAPEPSFQRIVSDDFPIVLNLFGRFELTRAGKPLKEKGEVRKLAKIMLTLLIANHGKDLSRHWLEQAIWPGVYTTTISSNFYNLWGYVKRLLISDKAERRKFSRSRDSISLRTLWIESDVVKADQLCDAFGTVRSVDSCADVVEQLDRLYKGALLPGVDNAQVEAYRMRYHNKILTTMVQGSNFLFKEGQASRAMHFASEAFHKDEAREDSCYTYMVIQRKLGLKTGALTTYAQCKEAMAERYGVDPPKRLEMLYQEILKEVS